MPYGSGGIWWSVVNCFRNIMRADDMVVLTCYRRSRPGFYPLVLLILGFWVGVLVNYQWMWIIRDLNVRVEVDVLDSANTSEVLCRLQTPEWMIENATRNVVPNVVHFIWFADDGNKRLTFLNYVSIRSAYVIQKPEVIRLHCNFLPAGQWWERAWREIPLVIVYRELPTEIHGQKISHKFHAGDIAKIEVLREYGGIYLDYDVLVVNSVDPLRRYDITLGKEKPPKFIAGIIMAKRNSLFLKLWYESYRDNYRHYDWDYNCARVAYKLYLERPDLIHVEPYKFTTPDWQDRRLLWNDVIEWRHLYVIHVMSHELKIDYTPEKIEKLNSTFGQVMRYIYSGSADIIERKVA